MRKPGHVSNGAFFARNPNHQHNMSPNHNQGYVSVELDLPTTLAEALEADAAKAKLAPMEADSLKVFIQGTYVKLT